MHCGTRVVTQRIGNPIGLKSGGGATASGRVYTTWCSEDGDTTTNAVEWELATTATGWWHVVHAIAIVHNTHCQSYFFARKSVLYIHKARCCEQDGCICFMYVSALVDYKHINDESIQEIEAILKSVQSVMQ